jgi:acetyltransferase-like isoleucine patch superfamily enzyme
MARPVTPRPEPPGGDRRRGTPAGAAGPARPDEAPAGAAAPAGADRAPAGASKPARPPGALERSAPFDIHVPPPPAPDAAVRRPPRPLRGGPRTFLAFARAHGMLAPRYGLLAVRWAWLKLRWGSRLQTDGLCFVAPTVKLQIARGATLRLGRWSWIGHGTKIRVHEGICEIGAKSVLGQECTISCFKHVSIGRECIVADRVMLIDFDHGMVEVERPIREQGIYKRDVRVGHNVWVGYGACFLRGVTVGDNAVVGTSAVVAADVPANAVVGGVPARLIRMRETPRLLRWT